MSAGISYPDACDLNGRRVYFAEVISGKVTPQSEYESSVLDFLRSWLTETADFVVYTSGSTGTPKAIRITRHQMIQSAAATEIALDLKRGYTSLICLDVKTIAGKMMIVRSLHTGMFMVIRDPSANPFVPIRAAIDFVALVPYQLEAILHAPEKDRLNAIKTVLIGGAPLKPSIAVLTKAFKADFFLSYGMTETISHVALADLKRSTLEESPAFKALPGINLSLDERECLVIEAPYLKEKVVTNDIVKIFSKIFFHWIGRFDSIINTGGVKVQPEKIEFQIEKIFKSLNLYHRFFIAGIPSEKTGELVALFIEGEVSVQNIEMIEQRLKNEFDRFHLPRQLIVMDEFSYTASGKLHRAGTVARHLT